MSYESRFNLPSAVRQDDPDHDYAFVDKERVSEPLSAGWKPVLLKDHPALAAQYPRLDGQVDHPVETGGQILMKRKKGS